MKQSFLTFQVLTSAVTREESFMGRDYLAVPVIALVQGVIQGSNSSSPELALSSEFAKVPAAWDGRPIVMGHPKNSDGEYVSANSPEILSNWQFGFMFNTKLIENSDKKPSLYTEAWIDKERANELNSDTKRVLERLEAGDQIEVSTGLYSTTDDADIGTYEGKRYSGIWRDVLPDHLAFLAEGKLGACSIADGCGAMRTNDVSASDDTNMQPGPQTPSLQDIFATQAIPLYPLNAIDISLVPLIRAELRQQEGCECESNVHGFNANNEWVPISVTPKANKGKKPYGNVEYADPGYQADSKSRFPVNTAEHIRAAWDAIHMPKISKKYSSSQVVSIEKKIVAAWKANIDKSGPPSAKNSQAYTASLMAHEGRLLQQLVANSYPADMVDRDVRALLTMAIDDVFDGYCYLLVFDATRVVFQWYDATSNESGTYSVPFTLDDDGKVTFTGPATQVAVLTRIIPVQQSEVATDADPDIDGDVDMVGNDNGNPPTINERGTTMSPRTNGEGNTTTSTPATGTTPVATTTAAPTTALAVAATPAVVAETTPAVVVTPATPRVQTVAEYIAGAPAEVRAGLEEAMRVASQKKDGLIVEIKASGRCDFTDEELKGMDLKGLERLAKLAKAPSFAGQGGGTRVNDSSDPSLRDNENGPVPAAPKVFENGAVTPAVTSTATH